MLRLKPRNSIQRNLILQELSILCHATADQIYINVRNKIPKISLGTVYRNLEFLCKAKIIQRIHSYSKEKRYDINPMPHYHIHCVYCNRLQDIEKEELKKYSIPLPQVTNFQITGYSLEFLGICNHCYDNQSENYANQLEPVERI